MESFREGLRRSGYVEGQNVAVELRYAQAGQQQLADRAADLVRAKVDVIATFGDLATKIAQNATDTIPIVALGEDLLGSGLIGSAWILEPSATGLCKPDLHVFAKLFEDCLKRGLEAQAFSGREIGGHDDVLDFLVGHFVDVDLTRQPAS